MNVGIVGCGLIGQKRAKALAGAKLVAVADKVIERANALSRTSASITPYADWNDLIENTDVEIVVVATTNDLLAPITLGAVQAGKHVLVEKPAARNAAELEPLIAAAEATGVQVRVGFNHRYHPALLKCRDIINSGVVGPLMFIRGRYGHGGRIGYDREWRSNPKIAGGGELLDQGVHLIDLARWFMGDFPSVEGYAHTYFWDMPVEDNGFMLLRTADQRAAQLHVSCTEWKNLFSLEIYGRTAKLHVEGLGGSYGLERLSHYQMLPEMGPPDTTIYEYPRGERSWELEFEEFLEDIRLNRLPAANLHDALATLKIVETIYARSSLSFT